MRIILVKKGIRNDQRQLVYVHEKPSEILPSDCNHVNYVPAVCEYPEITRIHSLKTVTTEGARL